MNVRLFHPGRRRILAWIMAAIFYFPGMEAGLAASKKPGTSILKKGSAKKKAMKTTRKRGNAIRASVRRQEVAIVGSPEKNVLEIEGGRQNEPYPPDMRSKAGNVLLAHREAGLSSDALEEPSGDSEYRTELAGALHGNKDSIYRIAQMYQKGSNGLPRNAHRAEQWLVMAAERGHGAASWQLAETYNHADRVGDAARYEQRAIELGYLPPPRLPSRGRNE